MNAESYLIIDNTKRFDYQIFDFLKIMNNLEIIEIEVLVDKYQITSEKKNKLLINIYPSIVNFIFLK